MSDIDKSSKSLIAIQKMIDQMTRDPLGDFVKQQEQVLNMASKMASAFDLNKTVIKISVDPLNSFQKQFLSPLEPYLNSINTTKIQCEALTEPYIRIQKILNDSFRSSVYTSFAKNDTLLKQAAVIQENVNSLASLFQGICIHSNYVSVPEILIPDDYDYEEIPTEKVERNIDKSPLSTKNISFSDALNILNMIITVLLWLISEFRNPSSANPQINSVAVESVSSVTEEQAQQIIDLLSTLSIQQQELIDLLELPAESDPKLCSESDDIRPQFATPYSAQIVYPQSPSTSHHERDSSESQTGPESQ